MKTYSITDVGQKRKLNQDYVFSSENPVGNLPNLFVVADGMGGHKAGDFASKYTVEVLVQTIMGIHEQSPIKILRQAIEKANSSLIEKAEEKEEFQGMGTTLVVATIIEEYLYVANVGDSRLYIVNKMIEQITKDHSLVEEMVRLGELDKEDAKVHPGKNIITRAIGTSDTVEVDFFDMHLQKEDKILMCSDGLTNMIEDKEICDIMNRHEDISKTAEELIKTANDNGGKDNIAVIIIEPFSDEVKEC